MALLCTCNRSFDLIPESWQPCTRFGIVSDPRAKINIRINLLCITTHVSYILLPSIQKQFVVCSRHKYNYKDAYVYHSRSRISLLLHESEANIAGFFPTKDFKKHLTSYCTIYQLTSYYAINLVIAWTITKLLYSKSFDVWLHWERSQLYHSSRCY